MNKPQKITVIVPGELLKEAQKASGEGITSTVQKGLELLAAGRAFADLRALKGRVKFSKSLSQLRRDRE